MLKRPLKMTSGITLFLFILTLADVYKAQGQDAWSISFDQLEPEVTMEQTLPIHFNLTGGGNTNNQFTLFIRSQDRDILETTKELVMPPNGPGRIYSGRFNIKGIFLGKVNVTFEVKEANQNGFALDNYLRVRVVREQRVIDTIFTISVATLVSLIYINFGCALNWGELLTSLKRPFGPIIGFVGQFVFMPLLSFGFGKLLFPDNPELQLGMFFAGISPGGGASNMWTVLLEGNMQLSITMTAISNLAAFFMMPFWIFTLGRVIFNEGDMPIPYRDISIYVVALVVPLFIGFLIQRYLKRFAQFMAKILKGFSAVLILFIVIFAIATNLYLFELFSWQIVVAGMGLPWLGYVLAYILARVCRQSYKNSLTIAIETGIQNTGISIFLLRFTLPQPEADITTVMPVAVATMTPFPLMVLYVYLKAKRRFFPDHTDGESMVKPLNDLESSNNVPISQKGKI